MKNTSDMSDDQIQNFIDNHRRQNATNRPVYLEALAEQAKRIGKGLNFETSFNTIRAAAAEGNFLAYKDLAEASNAEWSKVRYKVAPHLLLLVEYAHRRDWPMLSAVVVNKPNIATGKMEAPTLKGFVEAAQALGYEVTDAEEFLREQQEKVFAWAQETPGEN